MKRPSARGREAVPRRCDRSSTVTSFLGEDGTRGGDGRTTSRSRDPGTSDLRPGVGLASVPPLPGGGTDRRRVAGVAGVAVRDELASGSVAAEGPEGAARRAARQGQDPARRQRRRVGLSDADAVERRDQVGVVGEPGPRTVGQCRGLRSRPTHQRRARCRSNDTAAGPGSPHDQFSHGQPYYQCRCPKEYALANHVEHPRNVYLPKPAVTRRSTSGCSEPSHPTGSQIPLIACTSRDHWSMGVQP